MGLLRQALDQAQVDAAEAAEYLDHTRGVLQDLVRQAAGRPRITHQLEEMLSHVIAAGIKAEQANGHTQSAIEWLGGEVERAPFYFAEDVARPAVTS